MEGDEVVGHGVAGMALEKVQMLGKVVFAVPPVVAFEYGGVVGAAGGERTLVVGLHAYVVVAVKVDERERGLALAATDDGHRVVGGAVVGYDDAYVGLDSLGEDALHCLGYVFFLVVAAEDDIDRRSLIFLHIPGTTFRG